MLRIISRILFIQLALVAINTKGQAVNADARLLDAMKITVPKDANREVSFTNQDAAYYFTQTHQNNHQEYAWFEGMNIAKSRVFGGYNLFTGSQKLDNKDAEAWVYPYKLVRKHGKLTEELWMLDHRNVIEVSLAGATGSVGIQLKGKGIKYLSQNNNVAFFSPVEGKYVIAVSAKGRQSVQPEDQIVYADAKAGEFFIAVGKTNAEAAALIKESKLNIARFKKERVKRMQDFLLHNAYTTSSNDSLTLALNWLETTTNQLVTHQQGYGIYAGLPWFNEYWGRDEFISLPGATLVTGQFETAKRILKSFAQYQQTDPTSKYFGRVPNIINPQNIDYHTTDGTPRFIIELQDYVKYSGDVSLIRELYPNVKNSIEGALKYWVDDKGYLLHEDNETWMDARDSKLVSYSPRGTRANDIQALWYNQLRAGIYFARYMKDNAGVSKWEQVANKVKSNFEKDYTNTPLGYLADRLTKDGKAEFTLRPNQLFALDMINDSTLKYQVIHKVWQELVFPWGVSTLDKHDPFFHPFHLTVDYPKDEAYHNGTIWPWLNGIAMQRMIEAGQTETAYKLFNNMNRQALTLGVVGGLSENLDAYPHQGERWPRLTGAYLQAWSNAEQLRIWYQYFLGIRPDLANGVITIAPRIPDAIKRLDYNLVVGSGLIRAGYVASPVKNYSYSFSGKSAVKAIIDVYPYEVKQVNVDANSSLQLRVVNNELAISLYSKSGKLIRKVSATLSQARIEQNNLSNKYLRDLQFAKPIGLENHPVIKNKAQ
ncbi:amylo-alpha-1,6-glucosidase [Mucilaginibacter polytrichastri]|uniref:Glycogen debranching enzyme C-terminal domain-containing protein n=1 Tax=Mucilaginibacter polytrichastri TaxID=1302689 RepID=A0A1Q6A5C8_9SPHI|nr:amylo-alpha-1,6-glucosidase [Mucilaginibacter polytrichastri]OKS89214.1 hypothetical protein RG47T_4696 [Mucilaginibacter polytrichastri]SFS98104.1 glycogen debranching enzyme, putative [Mucilaginibacter polytrichastri]